MEIPFDAIKEALTYLWELKEQYEDYAAEIEDCEIVMYSLKHIISDRNKIDALKDEDVDGGNQSCKNDARPIRQLEKLFHDVKTVIDEFYLASTLAKKLFFGASITGKVEEMTRMIRRLDKVIKMVELETQTASALSLALLSGQQATNFFKTKPLKTFWATHFGAKTEIGWVDLSHAIRNQYGQELVSYLGHTAFYALLRSIRCFIDGDADGTIYVRDVAKLFNPKTMKETQEVSRLSLLQLLFRMVSRFEGECRERLSSVVMGGHAASLVLLRYLPPSFVVSADEHGMVLVWSAASVGTELHLIGTLRSCSERITAICVTYEKVNAISVPRLCLGGSDGQITVGDVYTGHILSCFEQYDGCLSDLLPMGDLMFACGDSSTITVYNIHKRSKVARLRGHRAAVNELAASKKYQLLISGGNDAVLCIWSIENLQLLFAFKMPTIRPIVQVFAHPKLLDSATSREGMNQMRQEEDFEKNDENDEMGSEAIAITCVQKAIGTPTTVLRIVVSYLYRRPDENSANEMAFQMLHASDARLNKYFNVELSATMSEDFDEANVDSVAPGPEFFVYTVKTTAKARNKNNLRCIIGKNFKDEMDGGVQTWKCKYEAYAAAQPTHVLQVNRHVLWANARGSIFVQGIFRAASCPAGHRLQAKKSVSAKLFDCERCTEKCMGKYYYCEECEYYLCYTCVGPAKPLPILDFAWKGNNAKGALLKEPSTPPDPLAVTGGANTLSRRTHEAFPPRLNIASGRGFWTGCRRSEKIEGSKESEVLSLFTPDRVISTCGVKAHVFSTNGAFLRSHCLFELGDDFVWWPLNETVVDTVRHVGEAHVEDVEGPPDILAITVMRPPKGGVPFLILGTGHGHLVIYEMNREGPWVLKCHQVLLDRTSNRCELCDAQLHGVQQRLAGLCLRCVRRNTERIQVSLASKGIEPVHMWKPASQEGISASIAKALGVWRRRLVWLEHGSDGLELCYSETVEEDTKQTTIPLRNCEFRVVTEEDMKLLGCDTQYMRFGFCVIVHDQRRVLRFACEEEGVREKWLKLLQPEFICPNYACFGCHGNPTMTGRIKRQANVFSSATSTPPSDLTRQVSELQAVSEELVYCKHCLNEQMQKWAIRVQCISVAERALYLGCTSNSCPNGCMIEILRDGCQLFTSAVPSTIWRWQPGIRNICSFPLDAEHWFVCLASGNSQPFATLHAAPSLGSNDDWSARASQVADIHTSDLVTAIFATDESKEARTCRLYIASTDLDLHMVRGLLPQNDSAKLALHAMDASSTPANVWGIEKTQSTPKNQQLDIQLTHVAKMLWVRSSQCNKITTIIATKRTVCAAFDSGSILVWNGVNVDLTAHHLGLHDSYQCISGPTLMLQGHISRVTSLSLHATGQLYSYGDDNTVHTWDFIPILRQARRTRRRRLKRKTKVNEETGSVGETYTEVTSCSDFGELLDEGEGENDLQNQDSLALQFGSFRSKGEGGKKGEEKKSHEEMEVDADSDESSIDPAYWVWQWEYKVKDDTTGSFSGPVHQFSYDTSRQLCDFWMEVRDFGVGQGTVEDLSPGFGRIDINVNFEKGEWVGTAVTSDDRCMTLMLVANADLGYFSETMYVHTMRQKVWDATEDLRNASDIVLHRDGLHEETCVELILQLRQTAAASFQCFRNMNLLLNLHILSFGCKYGSIDMTFFINKEPVATLGIEEFCNTALYRQTVAVSPNDNMLTFPLNRVPDVFRNPKTLYRCLLRISSLPGYTPARLSCVMSHKNRNPVLSARVVPPTWCDISGSVFDVIPPKGGLALTTSMLQQVTTTNTENAPDLEMYMEKKFQVYRCPQCHRLPRMETHRQHEWKCTQCGPHRRVNQPHSLRFCPLCSAKFGLFNRRNCYACGEVVCLLCSQQCGKALNESGQPLGYKSDVHLCRTCAPGQIDNAPMPIWYSLL